MCCSLSEHLEYNQGQASLGGLAENRLTLKKQAGSHRKLQRAGWPNFTFCFHDGDEVGPAAMAKTGKETGLRPEDF